MASNVFGAPIEISEKTLKALQALPGDAQLQEIVLKRRDRALVAMDLMCTGDKYDDTHSFLQALQSNSGVGVSTPVLFYNASGAVINLVQNHDYCGHIGASPYPITVHNGQWGAFLHVTASGASTGASASSAAVVYRGLDAIGNSVDWCFAWDTPSNKVSSCLHSDLRPQTCQHTRCAAPFKAAAQHAMAWAMVGLWSY
jgi:hypothetical protein